MSIGNQSLSYDKLVERLEQTFCPKGQSELYLVQLHGKQQAQESLQDFSQAVIRLTDCAYEGIGRDHFMANIREHEIRSAVHLSRPVLQLMELVIVQLLTHHQLCSIPRVFQLQLVVAIQLESLILRHNFESQVLARRA